MGRTVLKKFTGNMILGINIEIDEIIRSKSDKQDS